MPGKRINGSVPRINNFGEGSGGSGSSNTNDVRHPVSIDGFPSPMYIRAANIEVPPQVHREAYPQGR